MLGEALRLIRVFHDVTQQDLSAELDVAQSHLSEIESGKKLPTIPLLEKYAERFDIPLSSIMFFSETIDRGAVSERARVVVSKKILKILDFIAQRAGRYSEEKQEIK
jgi:transcriptional regulator with XRE-family HTH domain